MDEAVIRRKMDTALSEVLQHGYHSASRYIEDAAAEIERETLTEHERSVLNHAILETYYRALLSKGSQKCDLFDRFRAICASKMFSTEEISLKVKYALNIDAFKDDADIVSIEQRLLSIRSSFSDHERQ